MNYNLLSFKLFISQFKYNVYLFSCLLSFYTYRFIILCLLMSISTILLHNIYFLYQCYARSFMCKICSVLICRHETTWVNNNFKSLLQFQNYSRPVVWPVSESAGRLQLCTVRSLTPILKWPTHTKDLLKRLCST